MDPGQCFGSLRLSILGSDRLVWSCMFLGRGCGVGLLRVSFIGAFDVM